MPEPDSEDHLQATLEGDDPESDTQKSEGEIHLFSPRDIFDTLNLLKRKNIRPAAMILDPWYNRGEGDVMDEEEYLDWVEEVLAQAFELTDHVFLWGFPDIIWKALPRLPKGMELIEWLTWFYKNRPAVDNGWRSSQETCLHLGEPDANMHPEHFLTEEQLKKKEEGKLRYMPGPPSVIEASLPIGFVKQDEQTDHPSQKPTDAIEPLVKMATKEGELVVDPMAGSGTTAEVCKNTNRNSIISDMSEEYTAIMEDRLGITRQDTL